MKRLALSAVSLLALCGGAFADPLVDAARAGDGRAALALLADGADANAASQDGTTALHWAIHSGEADLVRRLIRDGADVSAVNYFGATPMSEAATLGDAAVLKMLLDAGADVESANADGHTALMIVARTGNVDAARLLIQRGADVNAADAWRGQTPLMHAAAESRPEMVKLLLDRGAAPDTRSLLNAHYSHQITAESRYIWRTPSGWTALLLASRQGCLACVEHLLDAGADIDLGNPENVSSLLIATLNLHFDTARTLIARGANVDKWDWRGRSPLFLAADLNTLPHGGRPDIPSMDETTALELARILIAAGANPNLQTKLNPDYRNTKDDRGSDGNIQAAGVTALMRAAKAFDADMIGVIATADPVVDLPSDRGLTALMIAAGAGSLERDTRGDYVSPDTQARSIAAIDALLVMGADINAVDNGGQSALFAAAGWGWTDVVVHLAENGARLDLKDNNGAMAIDAAAGRISRGVRTAPRVFPETAAKIEELMREQGLAVPTGEQLASAE